jgi:hypothetical protein
MSRVDVEQTAGVPGSAPSARRLLGGLAAILAVAICSGCGGGGGEQDSPAAASAADRQEIQRTLEEFLPLLAEAYATGDLEPLSPYAVERLRAYTAKRIDDLRGQGLVLRPRFHSLVIEDLKTWGNDFGVLTTLETWDLTYHAAGGDTVVSDRPAVKSRVVYQVKKEGGRWRLFHREMKQELTE